MNQGVPLVVTYAPFGAPLNETVQVEIVGTNFSSNLTCDFAGIVCIFSFLPFD